VPDDDGPEVEVWVFVSADLPVHWPRLDAFEGSDYQRAEIRVQSPEGPIAAWIYLDAGPAGRPEASTAGDQSRKA